MKTWQYFICLILVLLASIQLLAKENSEPIYLHYPDRAPYAMTTKDGKATGLFSTPAGNAFKKAHLPFVWVKTPINRQFLLLKENTAEGDERHCAVGFYKTAEREQYAKFTKPYYKSQGLVAIANKSIKKEKFKTFEEFMKNHTILLKENYSYGPEVDGFLQKLKPNKVTTSGEAEQMIQMITQGHGDFMVISREEINYYFNKGSAKKSKLHVMTFPDLPKGLFRYMMCSQSVSNKTLAKLNRSISFSTTIE